MGRGVLDWALYLFPLSLSLLVCLGHLGRNMKGTLGKGQEREGKRTLISVGGLELRKYT